MTRPILIVGAHGQVGRELLRRSRRSVPLVGLSHAELDITDRAAVAEATIRLRPALVINAAAYTAVDRAEQDAARAFAVNRDGPAHLAEACAAAAIPLLHISTDYVFDGRKVEPYREIDPVSPLGVYGASKLAGEVAIRETVEQHIILRTAWVFAGHGTNFVRTILRLSGENRSELRIVDDQRGAPTPAGAIADALLTIADQISGGKRSWGTYHFCGAPPTSWCGFARAIIAEGVNQGGRDIPIAPIATADYPVPARRPANSVLDCRKIGEDFGIHMPDWRRDVAVAVSFLMAIA